MPTRFYAKAGNFRVVLDPQLPVNGANGQQSWTNGRSIQFKRGTFTCTDHTARENGFESEKELTARLREAWSYGREFFEPENDPGIQYPLVPDVLTDIMTAVARNQHEKLVAILEQEEATHNRPEVVEPVKRALAEVGDTERGKRGPGKPPVRQPAKAEIS